MEKNMLFDDVNCSYRVEGKGKAIVLIHGFAEDGSMWNDTAKALRTNFKVVIPDLPGFGKSVLNNANPTISMEWYAAFVKAICNKEKIKSLVVLGHSMGGYIALYFAEKYPHMLKGFGLINSHCFEDSPEKKKSRKKGNAFVKKHGVKIFVRELYDVMFLPSFKQKNKALVTELVKTAETYSPKGLINASTAMMNREDKSDILKNTKVPVLMISGKEDVIVPLELSLKQASMPAISDFHLFGKTKHMTLFERKKEAISAIKEYLSLIK